VLPALLLQAATLDVYQLPLFSERTVVARMNALVDTRTGERVTLEEFAERCRGERFVYIGENHDSADAHRWQALLIGALDRAGRNVIVGLEMYQRPMQVHLDKWTLGKYDEAEFLERSDWAGQWGFDFALYRPIFTYCRDRKLRMVALNVPRDWVRTASRQGYDALPQDADLPPELELGNAIHRRVFDAMMEGHPPGAALEGMYRGQVLWDEGMADSALRYLERTVVTPNTVFVVLAGNGHVLYRQGINYRVQRRTGERGVTVVTVGIEGGELTRRVSADVGDYVIGIRPGGG
jgi:aminopeptidase N